MLIKEVIKIISLDRIEWKTIIRVADPNNLLRYHIQPKKKEKKKIGTKVSCWIYLLSDFLEKKVRKRAVALDCLLFGCLEKMGEMNCCIGKTINSRIHDGLTLFFF